MDDQSTAAEAGTPASGISTALDTGPKQHGSGIITQSEIPVTADMTVGAKRIADEINEQYRLARAKFAEHAIRCGELLLEQKRRVGYGNFGKWIEANCEFSIATANNYMKVAKNPSALGKSEAIRCLFPSGRKTTKKTISKEEMAAATDAETTTVTEKTTSAPAALMSGIPTARSQPREVPRVSVELAVKAIKAAVLAKQMRSPSCVGRLADVRGKVTRLRNELAKAEQDLAETEKQVRAAYIELKANEAQS